MKPFIFCQTVNKICVICTMQQEGCCRIHNNFLHAKLLVQLAKRGKESEDDISNSLHELRAKLPNPLYTVA